MIEVVNYPADFPLSPHAIFYRPLQYFSVIYHACVDGLDTYKGASFAIGNHVRFELRTYRGHAKFTVTLYLPDENDDQKEIIAIIKQIMHDMLIPETAVAWKRGDPITWGEVKRQDADRLRESEARILALKIAAQRPNRKATTQFIKTEVPKYIELSSKDKTISPSRPNEPIWRQIVGNVFSHINSPSGPFVQGYAKRTEDGLAVTRKGMAYLKSMGFVVT